MLLAKQMIGICVPFSTTLADYPLINNLLANYVSPVSGSYRIYVKMTISRVISSSLPCLLKKLDLNYSNIFLNISITVFTGNDKGLSFKLKVLASQQ